MKGLLEVTEELDKLKNKEMKLRGVIEKLEKKMKSKKYENVPEKVKEKERESL